MADSFEIDFGSSIDETVRAIDRWGLRLVDALPPALFRRGEAVMKRAKDLTPVDTGTLRNSGTVNQPEIEGNQVSVTIGFGGAAAPYAVFVHEDMTKRHPVGQAKFLEEPLREEERDFDRNLAADIRLHAGGGVG